MNKLMRLVLFIALLAGVLTLARGRVAWADATAAADPSGLASQGAAPNLDKPDPGSVKPPRPEIKFCEDGLYSVGGVATVHVEDLAPGYCLEAFLHNKNYALGRIPEGAGKILANVTFLRVFYHGKFTYEVPAEDGDIEICFAVPPGTQAQIYFYNHYGPRFGEVTGQPAWEPLPTTVEDGIACAPAQISGAYALIGE
jgi:hypothetical protein